MLKLVYCAAAETTSVTLADVMHGTVVAAGKDLLLKVKPVNFLLNSTVINDAINRGDCMVVNISKGTTYITNGSTIVIPMDAKLHYRKKVLA